MIKSGIYQTGLSKNGGTANFAVGTDIDFQREVQRGLFLIEEARAKAEITEQVRTQGFQQRLWLSELARERRNGLVESLEIDADGRLVLVKKNTFLGLGPQNISNLRRPDLTVLYPVEGNDLPCYQIEATLGKKRIAIFLDSSKIGRKGYLQRKFTAAGAVFEVQPRKINSLLQQLLGRLLSGEIRKKLIPESPGWVKVDGEWIPFMEVEETWEKIKIWAK